MAPDGTPALADDQVVATWRAITASHAAANAALEHELARLGLGVSEFEVLDRLSESPDQKFRAQELADAVHLSQSALSRLIDRLEKNGLVERCLCGEDRRGIYVLLSDEGLRRHAEAEPGAPASAGPDPAARAGPMPVHRRRFRPDLRLRHAPHRDLAIRANRAPGGADRVISP